mmetsp:Transcript_23248/g.51012  ORF Transcript_23248/g.51012 Transcript_23248/m.51012 type:complete len:87 (-) Transcript_23248:184-444(-)
MHALEDNNSMSRKTTTRLRSGRRRHRGPKVRPPPTSSEKFWIGLVGTALMTFQMLGYIVILSNYLQEENSELKAALKAIGVDPSLL